jgi:hypothetical protein
MTPNLPPEQESEDADGTSSTEVAMTVSEIVQVEEHEIERFVALGLGRYDAINAVEAGIDSAAVEALVAKGCPVAVALEIAH